jgi:hypothetical protein
VKLFSSVRASGTSVFTPSVFDISVESLLDGANNRCKHVHAVVWLSEEVPLPFFTTFRAEVT